MRHDMKSYNMVASALRHEHGVKYLLKEEGP
jgi:hypothetical protein